MSNLIEEAINRAPYSRLAPVWPRPGLIRGQQKLRICRWLVRRGINRAPAFPLPEPQVAIRGTRPVPLADSLGLAYDGARAHRLRRSALIDLQTYRRQKRQVKSAEII